MQPSFEALRELVRACGLDIGYGVVERDDSSISLIEESMRLTSAERVDRLVNWVDFLVEARESLAGA